MTIKIFVMNTFTVFGSATKKPDKIYLQMITFWVAIKMGHLRTTSIFFFENRAERFIENVSVWLFNTAALIKKGIEHYIYKNNYNWIRTTSPRFRLVNLRSWRSDGAHKNGHYQIKNLIKISNLNISVRMANPNFSKFG